MKPQITLSPLEEKTFEIIEILKRKPDKYHKINRELRQLSDFLSIHFCDNDLHTGVIKLINLILNSDIAEYYLFECSPKGSVEFDGLIFHLETIDDLKKYYFFCKKLEKTK